MEQYLTQQIGYVAPVLLVYLVGMVLSIIFLRKYPLPAILALAATLILFVTAIGVTMTQGFLIRARIESAWSPAQYSQMSALVSIIGTLMRTIGTAILIAAVFVGRKSRVNSQA